MEKSKHRPSFKTLPSYVATQSEGKWITIYGAYDILLDSVYRKVIGRAASIGLILERSGLFEIRQISKDKSGRDIREFRAI